MATCGVVLNKQAVVVFPWSAGRTRTGDANSTGQGREERRGGEEREEERRVEGGGWVA